MDCELIDKAHEIELKVVQRPLDLSSHMELIETTWQEEQKKHKRFNGSLLCVHTHRRTGNTLVVECFVAQYKYFLAQLRNDGLSLGIAPIGVSGLIIDPENRTVVAQRNNVTEYEGCYELVPSGGIDASKIQGGEVRYQEQLTQEFEEETGLPRSIIRSIQPFCLIRDRKNNVYDVACKIILSEEINQRDLTANDEYRHSMVVRLNDVDRFFKTVEVVPTSRIIIENH